MADKITYCEKYRKGTMLVMKDKLPKSLPIMNKGCEVVEMEVTESGKISRNGEEFEYVVCRIIMQ